MITFRNSKILKNFKFRNSKILNKIKFLNSKILKKIKFKNCKILKTLKFQNSKILNKIKFQNTKFRKFVFVQTHTVRGDILMCISVICSYAFCTNTYKFESENCRRTLLMFAKCVKIYCRYIVGHPQTTIARPAIDISGVIYYFLCVFSSHTVSRFMVNSRLANHSTAVYISEVIVPKQSHASPCSRGL